MTAEPAMTCQELVEVVTAYFEDVLPPTERARFEAHLQVCPPCRHYLDQVRATIDLTGQRPAAALTPAQQAEGLMVFRAWKRARPPA